MHCVGANKGGGMLELENVSKTVLGQGHIEATDLALAPGSFNILLGPTLSGKTTLLRLMAGLDKPTAGAIRFNGRDVTGVSVRKRDVAMVYQQFVNYPAMSVYENVAAPLRIAGVPRDEIDAKVRRAAERLRIGNLLDRLPAALSGGQQQRVALARAIVKGADLVLLDEPLVNLDYKLREELREELPAIFDGTRAIVVYATTEPTEALRLGGSTATLSEGRVTQFGHSHEVFANPSNLACARVFSDPPLNTAAAVKTSGTLTLAGGLSFPTTASAPDGPCVVAIRPHHLSLTRHCGQCAALVGRITDREITGNETFIHLAVEGAEWVVHAPGVEDVDVGTELEAFVALERIMLFSPDGRVRLDAPG
jgi:glycerol transport system ATP-binding protein